MQQDRPHAEKILRIVWIVLFLALCLVPSLGMLASGETEPSANEILAFKPELQKDGGDIEFIDLDGNKVKVKLTGMCQGCRNAKMTIKSFVESILKDKVDTNLEVEQI